MAGNGGGIRAENVASHGHQEANGRAGTHANEVGVGWWPRFLLAEMSQSEHGLSWRHITARRFARLCRLIIPS